MKKIVSLVVVAISLVLVSSPLTHAAGNLVGYWNFDEQSGASVLDTSGTGNNGSLNGGVMRSTSVLPPVNCFANVSSLDFNGSNTSYVDIPDASSMDPSSQITIAFWMNARTLSSSNFTHIVFKQNGIITSYGVWVDVGGHIYMETNDNIVRGLSGTSVLGTNTWHYIVATYDGTTQKLFVDGVMENSANLPGITIGYQNAPIQLGRGAWNLPFDGYLDDLRIYDRGLTDQEIADLAAGGCGPNVAPTATVSPTPSSPVVTAVQPPETLSYTGQDQTGAWVIASLLLASGALGIIRLYRHRQYK